VIGIGLHSLVDSIQDQLGGMSSLEGSEWLENQS